MDKIKVMLVDDHAIVRMGLASILGTRKNLKIVGEADCGETAIRIAPHLKPDVILMDMMLAGIDGAKATAEIHRLLPDAKILILTSYGTSNGIAHALKAGASGALLKTVGYPILVDAIQRLAAGEKVIDPEISRQLRKDPPVPELTERQTQILTAMTQGVTDSDIAKTIGLSQNGVREHITNIFNKLCAANRAEAIAIAMRKHLLKI